MTRKLSDIKKLNAIKKYLKQRVEENEMALEKESFLLRSSSVSLDTNNSNSSGNNEGGHNGNSS